jgi:electron transfer flavoprotein beta subunit
MEEGYQVVQSPLPVLLTVVKEINEPRLPSLRGKMRAKNAAIPVWGPEEIGVDPREVGLKGSPTYVARIFSPERKGTAKVFRGEPEETVEQLFEELRAKKLL